MRKILLILLFLINIATADYLNFHLISYHQNTKSSNNMEMVNDNYGISYTKEKDKIYYTVGLIRNSFKRLALFSSIGYNVYEVNRLKLLGNIGFISSYPEGILPLKSLPFISSSVLYELENYTVFFNIQPYVIVGDKDIYFLLHTGISYKF